MANVIVAVDGTEWVRLVEECACGARLEPCAGEMVCYGCGPRSRPAVMRRIDLTRDELEAEYGSMVHGPTSTGRWVVCTRDGASYSARTRRPGRGATHIIGSLDYVSTGCLPSLVHETRDAALRSLLRQYGTE